jgi:hypothetical protein
VDPYQPPEQPAQYPVSPWSQQGRQQWSEQAPQWPQPAEQPYQPAPPPYQPYQAAPPPHQPAPAPRQPYQAAPPPHQPAPQWSQYEYGGPAQPYTEVLTQAPRKRRTRTALILTTVIVLTLVAGGGAYAGFRLWYGSGAQPEDVVPASVAGFVRLDFDPGIGAGRKLETLLRKFPSTNANSTEARLDDIEKSLLKDLGLEGLDFATDIKPWFGNRVGVAVWNGSDQRPVGLVALASKDDGKARTALNSVQSRQGTSKFGYVLANGYALVARSEGNAQADAEAAAKEAKDHNLAGVRGYSDPVSTLPGGQTILAWVDLARAGQLFAHAGRGFSGLVGGLPLGSGETGGAADPFGLGKLTGHLVIGAQAADNGVEVRVRLTGSSPIHAGPNVRPALDALPGNAMVAVAVGQDSSAALNRTLGKQLTSSIDSMLDEILDPQTLRDPKHKPDPKLVAQHNEMVRKITDGITALLSAKLLSFALTSVGDEMPGLAITADTEGPAAAQAVVNGVTALGPVGLTATTQGNRVEVKTRTYAPTGKLADAALYRETIAGVPDAPYEAFFVDVTRFTSGTGATSDRALAPVKAVGGGFALDGNDLVGLVRIVIR